MTEFSKFNSFFVTTSIKKMEVQLKFCYETFTMLVYGRVRKLHELQESYYLKACKYVLLELISHYEIASTQNKDFKSVLSDLYLKLSSVQLQLARLSKNKDGFVQLSFLQSLVLLKASCVGKTASTDLCSISKNILEFTKAERQDENLNEIANTVQVQLITMIKSFEAKLSNLSFGENENVDSLFALHKARKLEYTSIVTSVLEKCIELLGRPPCQYALVGMRSMIASKLINPYSDLQILFVLENPEVKGDRQLIKTYFKNLSLIFHVVLCLGDAVVLPKTFVTGVLNDLLEGQVYNYLPIQFLKPTRQLDMFADQLNLPPPMLTFENFKNHSALNNQYNEAAVNKDMIFLSGDEALFTKLEAMQEQTLPFKDEIEDDWNAITSLTSRKYRRSVKNVDLNYLMLSRARRCKAAVGQICDVNTIDDNIASCLEFISLVAINVQLKMDSYLFVGSNESVPSFVEIVGTENAVQYFQSVLTIYDLVLEQNDKCWKNVFAPLAYYELGLFEEAIAGCKQLSENSDDGDELWLKNIVFYSLVHLKSPKAVDLLLDMDLETPFVNLLDASLAIHRALVDAECHHIQEDKVKLLVLKGKCFKWMKKHLDKDYWLDHMGKYFLETNFDHFQQFHRSFIIFEATSEMAGPLQNIHLPRDLRISGFRYKPKIFSKEMDRFQVNMIHNLETAISIMQKSPNRFSLSIAAGNFALAKAFMDLGMNNYAYAHFEIARKIWQTYRFKNSVALCYLMQGLAKYQRKLYSQSLDCYKKTLGMQSAKTNPLFQVKCLTMMAHCCDFLAVIKDDSNFLYEMELHANKVKRINAANYGSEFVLLNVSCQMLIGRSFYSEQEFEIAQKYYEDSIDEIARLPDFEEHKKFYYFCIFRLGCCFCRQSLFRKALELYECSLRSGVFESSESRTIALWSGTCLKCMRRFADAAKYYREFLDLLQDSNEKTAEDDDMVQRYQDIGFTCFRIGAYKEALECYEKQLAILKKLQNEIEHEPNSSVDNKSDDSDNDDGDDYEFDIAVCYFQIAKAYYEMGSYQKARELTLLDKGILETDKEENQKEIADCHKLLGQCHYAESQFAEAGQEFQCELEIREQITQKTELDHSMAWCRFNLGKCFFGEKQHKSAEENFEVAYKIWEFCHEKQHTSERKLSKCRWWLEKSQSAL